MIQSRKLEHSYIARLVSAYLMKGGFVWFLEAEPLLANLSQQKAKTQPDWKAMSKSNKGRPPFLRVVLQCTNSSCKRKPMTFKGATEEKALVKAWKVGWFYREEDGVKWAFCPKCKPSVENENYTPGRKLHDREYGYFFTITEYKGRGDHTLNFGHWPELWCIDDRTGDEKVFIFWEGSLPKTVHLVPYPGRPL